MSFPIEQRLIKESELCAPKSKTDLNPSWEAMLPFVSRKLPLVIHADEKTDCLSLRLGGKKEIQNYNFRRQRLVENCRKDCGHASSSYLPSAVSAPPQTNLAHDIHFRAPGI